MKRLLNFFAVLIILFLCVSFIEKPSTELCDPTLFQKLLDDKAAKPWLDNFIDVNKPNGIKSWEVLHNGGDAAFDALKTEANYTKISNYIGESAQEIEDLKGVISNYPGGLQNWIDDLANNPILTKTNPQRQRRVNKCANFLWKMGKDNTSINDIIDLVDLTKAVNSAHPVNSGGLIYRFERRINPNPEKHFFTDEYGANAGVSSVGFSDYLDYDLVTYQATQSTLVLKTRLKNIPIHHQYISSELQNAMTEISRVPATH